MMMFVLCTAFLMIYGEVQDGAMEHAHGIAQHVCGISKLFQIFPDLPHESCFQNSIFSPKLFCPTVKKNVLVIENLQKF